MTLQWEPLQLPFAVGLDLKSDLRAAAPPSLERAVNVQFDEWGGLQLRLPFAGMSTDIVGGGTLADVRRIFSNGDELLIFTKTGLYSWDNAANAWLLKATYMAVAMDEETVFPSNGDQTGADRAVLDDITVYTWADQGRVWVAARDITTDAVVLAPTNPSVIGANGSRPRVVALLTKILLTWVNVDGDLACIAIDPADVATSVAAAWTLLLSSPTYANGGYDVTQVIGADTAVVGIVRNPTTSYELLTVTASLTIARATKARTATVIAVSSAPGGNSLVQVCRANAGNLQGDLIDTSAMTDLYTAQAIGTISASVRTIAAAHRSTQDSSAYRCYVWWCDGEAVTTSSTLKYNWVDTTNVLGAAATFLLNASTASRAFDHDGHVYFWAVYAMTRSASYSGYTFGTQLQNGYFLYRDDGLLCAKATPATSGGYVATNGILPGVATTDGGTTYAWAGTTRRQINIGTTTAQAFTARAPRDITATFDSNNARRTARIGATLYVAGGELLQYDRQGLYEVGFHVAPSRLNVTQTTGAIVDGTYDWKATYAWRNGVGERERSTSMFDAPTTFASGSGNGGLLGADNLHITHKTMARANGFAPSIEFWRTAKDPTADAPFYRVSGDDPSAGAVANNFIANDTTAQLISTGGGFAGFFLDQLADADATGREPNPEDGGVLDNVAPPAATIILATQDRLFLAGIAGDPDRVWYSKLRGDGEVASFNDALTVAVPPAGGRLTGLAYFDETLVAYREHATYVLPGTGFDNLGGGQNFGPPHISSTDVGAINQESIALTPLGLVFKSSKGWYRLNGSWTVEYFGAHVAAYDSETIVATHLVESRHQLRVLTTARMLVFDYVANGGQWAEWTIAGAVGATLWRGGYVYLGAAAAMIEQSTYSEADYDIDVETAWIKLADLQGAGSVGRVEVIGAWQSDHQLRLRLARDYERTSDGSAWDYYDDETWVPDSQIVGGVEQMVHGPSLPKCSAIKARITTIRGSTTNDDHVAVPAPGALLKLNGLGLEVGRRHTLNRRIAVAQKA